MKKLFYCACVAALATACTNEELVPENNGAVSKGITFEATIEGTGIDSRGEMTTDYHFFWYAEQDRINVYADNVVAATTNTNGYGVVNNWSGTGNQPAVYKATKSASQGQFTAQDDANLISFDDNYNAYFVALYPTTTTISSVNATTTSDPNTISAYTSNVDFAIQVNKSNASQSVAMNQVDAPMYSKAYGKRSASYESVGEKMALSFKRPFPVLRFTSATNTTDLNSVIGKLNSVSITTEGATDASGYTLQATNIAADGATYNVYNATTVGDYVKCAVPTLTNGAATAEVTLTTPKTWGAGDNVYMSIYPVKREGRNGTLKKQMTEPYSVTYSYDNVTLKKNLSTSADWNIQHAVYEIEELNIANDFPWIVTNADSNGDRALVVFKGNFSDIYKNNTNQAQITWESATNGYVFPANITKIISYVALTNAELLSLKTKYTNLKELTLNANTSIPANVFNATLAGQITTLEMPLVTAIATTNNEAFSGLVKLNLKSYAFEEDEVYELFFNNNVQSTLKTLNIEAVTSLRPTFGYDRTIVFTDYAKLETVALNPNGVALTASAFKGCEALKTVTGKVDIANAPDAFYGASTTVTTHPTIEVVNTIIPNGAFQNALIKNIRKGSSQVVPTEIGESAFAGNTLVQYMDLSQATTIGKQAFKGATNFVGTNDTGRNVVTVIATTINAEVFANSAVVRVQFKNATTLDNKIFDGCTALKQVKFLTKVTTLVKLNSTTYAAPFGSATTESVDLFVPTTQSNVNGLVWTLVNETFKSITKEDTAWGN